VAISVDPPGDSLKLAADLGIHYPLLFDPNLQVASAFGVAMLDEEIAVPSVFVITRDRHIAWEQVGETSWDRASLEEVLEQVDAVLGK
jgi:peroxiredoxin